MQAIQINPSRRRIDWGVNANGNFSLASNFLTSRPETGTGTISSSGVNITGVSTLAGTEYGVGSQLIVGYERRTVATITNATSFTVDEAFASNLSGASFQYATPSTSTWTGGYSGAVLCLGRGITTTRSLTVDIPFNFGVMVFDEPQTYNLLASSGVLVAIQPGDTSAEMVFYSSAGHTIAPDLRLGSNLTFLHRGTGNQTFSGIISGNKSITRGLSVTSGGRIILSGNNTYSGGTYNYDGAIQANSNTALGSGDCYTIRDTSAAVGPTFRFNGVTISNNFFIRSDSAAFFFNAIATEVGTLNTLTGTLTIGARSAGGNRDNVISIGSSSTLNINGPVITEVGQNSGAKRLSLYSGSGATVNFNGVFSELNATQQGAWQFAGSGDGAFNILAASTVTGGGSLARGIVNVGGTNFLGSGTITFGDGSNTSATNTALYLIVAGSSLSNVMTGSTGGNTGQRIIGGTNTSGNVTFSGTISCANGRNFTFESASGGTVTFSGVISGGDATSTLTKQGAGTVILTATNTYGAIPFAVNAGTLRVTGSLPAGSPVTVNGGTLEGTGTINGTVSIASGAVITGDAAAVGTLSTGALTMQTGATMTANTSGATMDRIAVTGNLTLNSNVVNFPDASLDVGTYDLFTYTGSLSGTLVLGTNATGRSLAFQYVANKIQVVAT